MAPRWFKNINFGRDVSNTIGQEFVDKFKNQIQHQLKDFTFNSTGPLIEEVQSEDEEQPILKITPAKELDVQPIAAPSPVESIEEQPLHESTDDESLEEPEENDALDELTDHLSINESSKHKSLNRSSKRQSINESSKHQSLNRSSKRQSFDESTDDESIEEPNENDPLDELTDHQSINEPSEHHSFEEPIAQVSIVEPAAPSLVIEPTARSVGSIEVSSLQEPTTIGPRRSHRKKWAPLDFARGERPIYKRNGLTFELAGFDKGFPEKYSYSRQRQQRQQPRQPQQQPPKRPPSGSIPVPAITFKQARKGHYLFQCKQINSLITGEICLEVGKSKPETKTDEKHMYMFLVRSGQVVIKVADNKETKSFFLDAKSEWLELQQGMRYSIKNCGRDTARVAYLVSDRQ